MDKVYDLLINTVTGLIEIPFSWLFYVFEFCLVLVVFFLPLLVYYIVDNIVSNKYHKFLPDWVFSCTLVFQVLWWVSAISYMWGEVFGGKGV